MLLVVPAAAVFATLPLLLLIARVCGSLLEV